MTKDESKVNSAIADIVTLSGRLKLQSEEVKCELCASSLLIASVLLEDLGVSMQNKLNNGIELKCGITFEKCDIGDFIEVDE